jgi:hypothetical protein
VRRSKSFAASWRAYVAEPRSYTQVLAPLRPSVNSLNRRKQTSSTSLRRHGGYMRGAAANRSAQLLIDRPISDQQLTGIPLWTNCGQPARTIMQKPQLKPRVRARALLERFRASSS